MKISLIGGGNMPYAIVYGALNKNVLNNNEVIISDISTQRLEYIAETINVNTTKSNIEAAEASNIIVLGVKPNIFEKVAKEIQNVCKDKCIISIMAGVSTEKIKKCLGKSVRVLRVMPNMPALVGEGMSAICSNNDCNKEEYDFAKMIFESVGKVCEIDEKYINAVIGISGSGPAYAFMFIEALADAGVLHGLPRNISYQLAIQMLKGSAVLCDESDMHPGVLKDQIASPGGTTIEAIKSLEDSGFRGSIINAVDECIKKADRLQG